ncbi:MAG: patatin-like phospholipase family protein [Ignavibacteriae bacterium]|nr:patatin-like phospholipase family protein [Ignavibacteriota bacterium]
MIKRWYTSVRLLFVLLCCAPVVVFSESKITIRPQLDESLSSRHSLYPYKPQRRPKIALVLSGGGARGVAQIGVLKVLERYNIPIDFISATSLGAIVGGLYASGYTTAEIETLALSTNWDDVLSLTQETRRTDLVIDQKLADDWSFLVVRFRGLDPVIPTAVSSGQRLTDFLSTQTLQALYHPNPSFDDLKTRFRAVSTDLVSGKRIILDDGSLAEALRASATVPLLFNPVEKDSMQLIDGGLVSNIPVDVARNAGYDIVIAVNSTSGLRGADELKVPWQTADQIMGIMMQLSNEQQLRKADIVITPDIGKHLSSNFQGLDSLIHIGEQAAEQEIDKILDLYRRQLREKDRDAHGFENDTFHNVTIEIKGDGIPDSLVKQLDQCRRERTITTEQIRSHVRDIYGTGDFKEVYVDIHPDTDITRVTYHVQLNPRLQNVELTECKLIPASVLRSEFQPLLGQPLNQRTCDEAMERVLRLYRARGYSLARFSSHSFDEESGTLQIEINEGVIDKIVVKGSVRATEEFVLREFPIELGEVFQIDKAKQGLTNISSTRLFEYVYLEVSYMGGRPMLTIRLNELPSQLVRFGLRADNERNLQGTVDIRDENFQGSGAELGLTASGGSRNAHFNVEYKSHRVFSQFFTFNISAFYSSFDSYVYVDDPHAGKNRWARQRVGEYSDIRYGGSIVLGSRLEQLGNTTIEFTLQNVRIKNLENAASFVERYRLALLRLGTIIDSKNQYPFPTTGVGMKLSYEFALKMFASQIGYNALRVMYEGYTTWGGMHTLHPKVTFGFADRTMPLAQQFRLGGRESLFGVREDDRRGRQLLAFNLEYRYHLPVRVVFDTYMSVRYDLGFISEIPEQIKFTAFRHGIGAELALDSPIGPAIVGLGKGFFLGRDLPDNPIQHGPLLFYFMVGYEL